MLKSEALDKLRSEEVVVEFEKANGAMRTMTCTLKADVISQYKTKAENPSENKDERANVSVWDIEVNGWRSFIWSKVRRFNGVNTPNGITK